MKGYKLIFCYLLLVLFIILSVFCLTGCKSKESIVENNTDSHKVSQLFDKMDSLVRTTKTWQQDLYSKQSSLIDSIKQFEKNDSSHVVIVNEKGDTVKERVEIHHYVEKEHNTESKESETIIHLQSQVDSLINLSIENKALTDSLLKEHSKETVIVKEPTLWERIKASVGGWAIGISVLFIIFIFIKLIIQRRRA